MRNSTESNIKYTQVIGTFYDSSGTVIGSDYTFTILDIIIVDETSPFELSSYPNKIQPSSYKLDVQYRHTPDQPFDGLVLKSWSGSTDSSGYYRVVGEVQNSGNGATKYVQLIATFYDDAGDVIGTDYTFSNLDTIPQGGSSPFSLSSYPLKINPAQVKIQIQGRAI